MLAKKIFSFTEKNMKCLFNLYYKGLVAYASEIVSSKTVGCDIVQNVFLKLWEKQPEIKVFSIKAYLFVQTRNTCISYLRCERIFNNRRISLDESGVENLYAVDFLEEADDMQVREKALSDVEKFVETLPPQTRNVFRMSRLESLSHKEIALKLGVSEKAIEKHITIALKRFKSFFGR